MQVTTWRGWGAFSCCRQRVSTFFLPLFLSKVWTSGVEHCGAVFKEGLKPFQLAIPVLKPFSHVQVSLCGPGWNGSAWITESTYAELQGGAREAQGLGLRQPMATDINGLRTLRTGLLAFLLGARTLGAPMPSKKEFFECPYVVRPSLILSIRSMYHLLTIIFAAFLWLFVHLVWGVWCYRIWPIHFGSDVRFNCRVTPFHQKDWKQHA